MQLVIFPVLGPLIGSVTFHLLLWATTTASLWPNPMTFVMGYFIGFVPAFFTGIGDALLSMKLSRWWRIPITASVGYVLSALMAAFFYAPPYVGLNDVLIVGAFGVFPAAVCSWLSGKAA
jgi:hypothetical protein